MSDLHQSTRHLRHFEATCWEEDSILDRLAQRSVIGVTAPERIQAAHALATRGVVIVRDGEGKDRGVLLVERAPRTFPRAPSGGSVA